MAPTTSRMEDDAFTLVEERGQSTLYKDYAEHLSAKTADHDLQIQDWLRNNHHGLNLTAIPSGNAPLLPFANAGNAKATLDTTTEPVVRWRGYVAPARRGGQGGLGDSNFFAKYHYVWAGEDFIIYSIGGGYNNVLYILKEPDTSNGEDALSHCSIVDKLILSAVEWSMGDQTKFIYVYDGYWRASRELWDQIQQAEWKDVILDPTQKKALTSVSNTFFDSEEVYRRYGVPWKRGLIFYGPPGNGKTVSIKALMHELYRRDKPIPTLYVKSAPRTYDIRSVFQFARRFKPCLLVMEDIETIVTQSSRSYFFNEVDGLENNDGILMVASTNYLDRLDPGLSQRPSRFDRKYLFPLPNLAERTSYAAYWRTKLSKSAPTIEFPEKLCGAIANITGDFSFAYMQEAFVAALLDLARSEMDLARTEMEKELYSDQGGASCADQDGQMAVNATKATKHKHDELDKYPLWTAIKASIKVLRGDLGEGEGAGARNTIAESPSPSGITCTDLPNIGPRSLDGLSFAVTGDLPSLGDRSQVYDLIRRHGGAVDMKPDASTSFLVVGTDAGAKKNHVRTIGEQDLLSLIASGESNGLDKKGYAVAWDEVWEGAGEDTDGRTGESYIRDTAAPEEEEELESMLLKGLTIDEQMAGPSRGRHDCLDSMTRDSPGATEATGNQLYGVGVGKGPYLTARAFEQRKLNWG